MFSNAVKIDNLNDYNKESEECVKSFLYEIEEDKPPKLEEPNLIHIRKKNTKNNIKKRRGEVSLSDCLACSGCVTNEETTFLKSQNSVEIINTLKNKKINIISLSLQSVVALSIYFDLPLQVTQRKLCFFFKSINFDYVFDSSLSELITLNEAKKEFNIFFNESRKNLDQSEKIKKEESNQTEERKKNTRKINTRKENIKNQEIKGYIHEKDNETKKETELTLKEKNHLPLICAHCSGVVIYGEKNFDDAFLNSFSKLKSNQEIQGIILKFILLQKGLSSLYYIKNYNFNNFFQFYLYQRNFIKICKKHFVQNSNLFKIDRKKKKNWSLDIFDINHVYLLYCFDKKIEAHINYEHQQKVIKENVNEFLMNPFMKRHIEQEKTNLKKERKIKKNDKEMNTDEMTTKTLHFVDAVLTTVELVELIENININFYTLPELELDNVYSFLSEYKKEIKKKKLEKKESSKESEMENTNNGELYFINVNSKEKRDNKKYDLEATLKENDVELKNVFDKLANYSLRTGNKNNISMGYGEEIFKDVCKNIFHFPVDEKKFLLQYSDIIVLSLFENDICVFRVVLSYGFKSMHKVINKIKQYTKNPMFRKRQKTLQEVEKLAPNTYKIQITYDLHFDGKIDYIELMACERGCLFGCAQNIFQERIKNDNADDCFCHNMYIFKKIRENDVIENWNFLLKDINLEKESMNIFCSNKKCADKKCSSDKKQEKKKIIIDDEKEKEKNNLQFFSRKANIEHLFDKLNKLMHDDGFTFYVPSYNTSNDSVVSTFLTRLLLVFKKSNFHIFKRIFTSRKKSDIINW